MSEKREQKKILTPDQFEVNEKGEVVIKDQALLNRLKEAKQGDQPGEQGLEGGVGIGIVWG